MATSQSDKGTGEIPRLQRFFRRRRYIVDRDLQFGLIRAHLILFGTALGFLAAGIFAPLVTELNSSSRPEQEMLTAASMMLYMHERLWLLFALTAIFLMLGLLRLSHKIAGPLYRFRSVVSQAKAGVPPGDIRLRRGDFLHKEAEQLSLLIGDMTLHADLLRRTGEGLKEIESKLCGLPGLQSRDREELLNEVLRMQDDLQNAGEWRNDA
ncbi:MAG: hypothetical protein ACYTG5_19850 [Planctomycetota bacterium]